jgi:hypothetical protein
VNLDFSAQPLFSWYVLLLIFSGIAMLVMGALNSGGLSKGWRALNLLFGLGFAGYGIYLGFIFKGGEYIIFFKALILPVLMIVNYVRAMSARRRIRAAQPQGQMAGMAPGQFPGQAPGPYAGQVPGQAPGQMPGQVPGQAPGQYR